MIRAIGRLSEMLVTNSLAGVLLLGAALLSGQAFGHARLVSSEPAANAKVSPPPAQVSLSFSEALEPHFSSVVVTGAGGTRVDANDLAAAQGNARTVRVTLKPLEAGTYTVTWRAVSVDTHRTRGSFTFAVKP